VWATENNLKLNKLKTREIVFYDNRRRSRVQPPPPLSDVARDTTLKILGVTFCSNLSASAFVRRVVSDSAKSLNALRVLCYHCMNDASLQTVSRTIVDAFVDACDAVSAAAIARPSCPTLMSCWES
jgi:hypothetical protein